MTRDAAPALHKRVKDNLKSLLNETTSVSLNIDIRSSKCMRGYLGETAHFIDANFHLRNVVLACTHFTGELNAAAIFNLAVDVIQDYNIRKKVFFVGTDNGSNIVNALKDWMPGFIEVDNSSGQTLLLVELK